MNPEDPHERVAERIQKMDLLKRAEFVGWHADYDPDGIEMLLDKYEAARPRPETQSGP